MTVRTAEGPTEFEPGASFLYRGIIISDGEAISVRGERLGLSDFRPIQAARLRFIPLGPDRQIQQDTSCFEWLNSTIGQEVFVLLKLHQTSSVTFLFYDSDKKLSVRSFPIRVGNIYQQPNSHLAYRSADGFQ